MSALIATAGEGPAGPGRAAQAAAALRRNAVAALGELLFYIVTQEPVGTGGGGGGMETERWNIPVAAVAGVIGKCLLVVDDASGSGGGGGGGGRLAGHEGARHYAAKTMENVLAQVGPSHPLVPALVTPELALGLLDLARHASSENLRRTATAALYHVFGHDILGGEFSQDRGDDDDDDEIEASRGIGSESAGRGARRGTGRRRSDRAGDDVPAAGCVASRVMREPGAPEFIVQGLSAEGSSATSRRAFLGMFNLVVWASGNCGGGRSVGGRGPEDDEFAGGGRRNAPLFLRRAVECMLDSQHLLLRLLRVAEHGEGAVLRAKGFLSLRLALEEAADPGFLLKACRSRLLPLLARAIGGLAPRSAPRGPAEPASASAAGIPELSPQQEYLYECSTLLAEWLCAVPETAARRLATELLQRRGVSAGGDGVSATTARDGCDATGRWGRQPDRSGGHRSGGGAPPRRFGARQQASAAGTAELEAAMGMFQAVVHLVNSPLLRERAVTRPFVSDVAGCLALSCPALGVAAAGTGRGNSGGGGSSGRSSDRRAVSPAAGGPWSGGGGGDGSAGSVVLAALLPTVETLAQQAELVLVPHRGVVSAELIPVLCRFLRSPSGDTRALVVAIFRVLLPPLVRPQQQQQQSGTPPPLPPPARPQQQRLGGPAETAGWRPSSSSSSPSPVAAEDLVRSAFADHLLPHAPSLLGDHDPIPQYTIRLLLDVGRAWGGLGMALLCSGRDDAAAAAPVAAALLDRLSGTPLPAALSPRGGTRTGHEPPGDAAAVTTLDPALACLLSLLVDDGAGTTGAGPGRGLPSDRRHRQHVAGTVHYDGDDSYHGGENDDVFVALLGLELPRRTAAAVAAAVKAGAPEVADACLGLAVALLDAGARRKAAAEALLGPVSGTERAAAASTCRGAGTGAAAVTAGEQWEEQQLRPLLAAVPLAVETVNLFCVQGALAEKRREHQLAGAPVRGREGPGGALGGVDDGVRSGVSDSATLFLEMCYKMFGESLLRSLLLTYTIRPTSSVSGGEPLPSLASGHAAAAAAAAPQARVFRQLADFLACPAEDERPRIRILRLLLSAVSTLGQPFYGTLRRGPLWTALLRLATGRGIGSGREAVLVAGVGGSGARTALGATSALARDVVAAVREDRGYNGPVAGAEPRGWSGRSGSSRGERR
ncbi:expressed unknown protein [Ectocarpus siliculosus]|uniref:Serine/threonine-protein kinase ULK4/RUNKEL HEAT repeats domain-containing protein n=1 Tax=Ectocarpus siliculosus TaxID=2880 RepID=D7FRN8_ECTSI|nr:expressed unknown protein [Ectocarpus siliculosus]|eukprot:CBJ30829.1 expressed unknown protein [Ectocarpus siliculosus]